MCGKDNKKEFTFDSLNQELDSVQQSRKIDIKKISNVFCRVQDVKGIKKEGIEQLFFKAINVSDKNSWEFLLEIYSRFYNRVKVKNQKEIIQLIEDETKKRLDSFITHNEINNIVSSFANEGKSRLLEEYFDKFDAFCKEKKCSLQEVIAYVYVALLIAARRLYLSNVAIVAKIERKIFVKFAKDEKADPLFVKSVKKSLIEGKFGEKFKEITYLYDGVDEELAQLKEDNSSKKEFISSKLVEIRNLKENILELNDEILRKSQEIKDKEAKIVELELLVSKTDDRNEYNENLYKQQFLSLKRNLVEKLRKELQLEIEGLEDIADTLSDSQKEKVQRRIDRIYKILQKVGD